MSTTTRVSVSSNGTPGNDRSYSPAISNDGRYIAFESLSSNLVSGDTNNSSDIFLYDSQTGITRRVSLANNGDQGNSYSGAPDTSNNGRYTAFESSSNNLVSGDTNNTSDIFVHDRNTGATTRVSISSNGNQGNGESFNLNISSNGRYVAFESLSSNLVPGDTNNTSDIFVHDRNTRTTSRVSVASNGNQGNNGGSFPSISDSGSYVAFQSWSDNLVPEDSNSLPDIFLHNRNTGTTTRVSVASDGTQGNGWSYYPSISGDSRYVAFESWSSNLVPGDTNNTSDVFVYDRISKTTTRVSVSNNAIQGNGGSYKPSISKDGRYVTFSSEANNLVPGDTNNQPDIFVRDLASGTTTRISVSSNGTQGNNWSYNPSISGDGTYVAFESTADNLVSGNNLYGTDVFVHQFLPDNLSYDLTVNPATFVEGDSGTTSITYTVTRYDDLNQTSNLNYTLSGTANNGQDYQNVPQTGTFNFAPGETTQTLTIQVNGDLDVEQDETLKLTLNQTSQTATAIILDNDSEDNDNGGAFPPPGGIIVLNGALNPYEVSPQDNFANLSGWLGGENPYSPIFPDSNSVTSIL